MGKIEGCGEEDPPIKRLRRERGGKKVAAQKVLRKRVEEGTYIPQNSFPNRPNFGSQIPSSSSRAVPIETPEFPDFPERSYLGDKEEDPELVEILTETAEPEPFNPPHPEKESSSTAPAEPEGNPATSASSSSGASLLTAPNSDLRPRPSVVSTETRSSVGPATTRILIVSDFHGVIDTEEFLKFDRGRREETSGNVPLKNRQAVLRLLNHSPQLQLGILSYVGKHSYEKRNQTSQAIRDLNGYLASRGCSKQVGLQFTDRPEHKAAVIVRARPRFFVDDKFSIVDQTASEVWDKGIQTEVFFLAERRPRNPYLTHVQSFEQFVNCVIGSLHRCDPVEDRPVWSREFPAP